MLLIVCNVTFFTLAFPLPRPRPPSLYSSPSPATELNLFCCAFVCKSGIARGVGGCKQIHTERRPGAQAVPSNNGSVYSPHTKITCANKNKFGSLKRTFSGKSASVSKKHKKVKSEELWLRYLLNVVTVTSYIAELLYTL